MDSVVDAAAPCDGRTGRGAHVRRLLRSCRSKALCNCAAVLSVSEPVCSRSRTSAIRRHSRIARVRRHAAPLL